MKTLQVKKYHQEIAKVKQEKALECWKAKNSDYGYPVKSMFYFLLSDSKGYPTEERQRGYVAFTENKACFGINEIEAIKYFYNII